MKKSPTSQGENLALTFLVVTAWLGCTLAISMPGSIFLANRGDFTIETSELFMFTVPLLLVGLGIASIIYLAIPKMARPYFVSVMFALASLTWFQGNVLIWDYGPLDGRSISWAENRSKGFIDAAIWITVLTLSLFLAKQYLKIAFTFSAVIIVVSLSMIGITLLQQSDTAETQSIRDFQIDATNKFFYSSERNVILIVLDAFQSDVFAEVMEDDIYARVFDGFAYFPDAVAASNFTQVSIPTLLTGELYDNTVPKSEFLRDSFLKYGITTLLLRAGFEVDIYPWVGWGNETIHFDEAVASNLKLNTLSTSQEKVYSEQNGKEVLHLIDLTLFRVVPHFLKRFIYNGQQWFMIEMATALVPTSVKQTISTDNEYETNVFVRDAVERAALGSPEATFKYYHLKGAHMPLSVDSDLSFSSENFPYNRTNYVSSVKANINSIGEFLNELKSKNVFGNSLIFIVGDHGSGNSPDVYIEPGEIGERMPGVERNFQKDKARGVPLVLVKRIGATAPITANMAPVSLSDIPATILSELGIEGPAVGRSVFAIAPGEDRVRTYAAFDYSATHSDYVAPLTIYKVNGNSWHDSSWSVRTIRHPQGSE